MEIQRQPGTARVCHTHRTELKNLKKDTFQNNRSKLKYAVAQLWLI